MAKDEIMQSKQPKPTSKEKSDVKESAKKVAPSGNKAIPKSKIPAPAKNKPKNPPTPKPHDGLTYDERFVKMVKEKKIDPKDRDAMVKIKE